MVPAQLTRIAQGWATLLGQPATRGAYKASALAVTLILLGLALLYTAQQGTPIFPVDDSYIVSHNAEQLFSRSPDPHFSGTPALAGSTSALHLLLVASFALLMPVLWAQWWVMILGALAYALSTLRLGFVLRVSILEAWLLLVLGMLVAQMPHQLANGLETSWALAALTLALAAARDTAAHGRRWELPLLCGLMPFLRPELAAVSALLLGARVYRDWQSEGPRSAMQSVAIAAAVALPWLALYWGSLGTPFPNTIEAKRNFFAEGCRASAQRSAALEAALFSFQDDLGLLYWIACLLPITALGRLGLVFSLAFGLAYHVGGPSLLRQYEQRYLYLLIPWLIYSLGAALSVKRRSVRALSAVFLLVCIAQSGMAQPGHWRRHLGFLGFTRSELQPLAKWLNEHARGRRILLHDAGYVGFAVDAPQVDLVGLKTPTSLAPHRELTFPRCNRAARNQAILRIAEQAKPEYLVVIAGWDRMFGITSALSAHGFQLDLRYLGQAYRVYEIHAPN